MRELQRAAVAAGQLFRLALLAAVPDRSNRVNHKGSRKPVPVGDFCVARCATAERRAFRKQPGAGGTVNCSVDSAPAQQRTIRRINNRINPQRRDICPYRFHTHKIQRLHRIGNPVIKNSSQRAIYGYNVVKSHTKPQYIVFYTCLDAPSAQLIITEPSGLLTFDSNQQTRCR